FAPVGECRFVSPICPRRLFFDLAEHTHSPMGRSVHAGGHPMNRSNPLKSPSWLIAAGAAFLFTLAVPGCGSDGGGGGDAGTSSGGKQGSGGASASGGANGSGGASASGGRNGGGTGGESATGGRNGGATGGRDGNGT